MEGYKAKLEKTKHFGRKLIGWCFTSVFWFLIFCNYKAKFPKTFTAKLCEILNATRVFSPGNMMVIHFKSDGEKNFQRFKARFSVLPSGEYKHLYDCDILLMEMVIGKII